MAKHQKKAKTTVDDQQTSTGVAHDHEKKNVHSAESKLVHEVFIKQEPLDQNCSETGSDERDSQIDVVKREVCGNSSDLERPMNHSKVTEIQDKSESTECMRAEIKETQRSRLTADQRWIMVEFVRRYKALITGRCSAPVVARQRAKVLSQMAKTLNNTEDGAVKTPDKWLRSFQDWKSDVRKKAAKFASLSLSSRGTSRGPQMSGLSAVERELLDVLGEPVVSGRAEIADTLEGSSSSEPNPDPEDQILSSADLSPAVMTEPSEDQPSPQQVETPQRERKRKRRDEDVDDRIAAAMEQQAEALIKISEQITQLTDVFTMFYYRWAQQTND